MLTDIQKRYIKFYLTKKIAIKEIAKLVNTTQKEVRNYIPIILGDFIKRRLAHNEYHKNYNKKRYMRDPVFRRKAIDSVLKWRAKKYNNPTGKRYV